MPILIAALGLIALLALLALLPLELRLRHHMDGPIMTSAAELRLFPLPAIRASMRVEWVDTKPKPTYRWGDGEWRPFTSAQIRHPAIAEFRINRRVRKHIARFLRRMKSGYIKYESIVGTTDAALTALLCGLQQIALHALLAPLRDGRLVVRASVLPNFAKPLWSMRARCILRFALGHGMIMFLGLLGEYIAKAVHTKWTNIRSKTSCERPWRASGT